MPPAGAFWSLSAYALVLTLLIGMGSGILAALRQNTWVDQAAMIVAMIGISVPNFYLGLLMSLGRSLLACLFKWIIQSYLASCRRWTASAH